MSDESRKPYQTGSDVFKRYIRGYSPPPFPAVQPATSEAEQHQSVRALEMFVAQVEDLKRSLNK